MLDRHQLTADLLTDYALGFLSPSEASEVEEALERYPEARQEVNHYLDGLTDLAMDLAPAPVPDGAADRLLARLNAEVLPSPQPAAPNLPFVAEPAAPTPAPRRSWLYALLAVAAVAVIGVAVVPGLLNSGPSFASYQAEPGAVTAAIKGASGAEVAQVVRLPDGHAYVQMLAGVPAGRTYQAWKIEGGKPVSLGLFKGQGYVAALPAGTVFAVTVEPEGGSPQPTTTPLFAQPI